MVWWLQCHGVVAAAAWCGGCSVMVWWLQCHGVVAAVSWCGGCRTHHRTHCSMVDDSLTGIHYLNEIHQSSVLPGWQPIGGGAVL